jgi:hypothetical protein
MKLRLILLISLLSFVVGCGTGMIQGKIVDEQNDPVVGAQVYTEPPTVSKLSTVNGFEMKKIPTGVYTVNVMKSGYSKESVDVEVRKNTKTTAEIQLKKIK